MRLFKLRLVNYIGVYNGMGLHEIAIDFEKCQNNIIVIKGDNGSGKSTIFNAMTPLSDDSSNFIPGKEARKEIAYLMEDGTIIKIQYVHSIDKNYQRKPAKCYIHKLVGTTETDLNPNGNMTEGKEMICTLFDFDPNFNTLAQLSSEDRGLADKKPAERKRFINSIMESMSVYNELYKKLAKKSSALKTTIGSINAKISSIGNKDMITNRIHTLEESLGNIEDRRALLLAEMGAIKNNLESINSNEVIEKVTQIKIKLQSYTDKFTPCANDESLDSQIQKLSNDIARIDGRLESLNKVSEQITSRIIELNKIIEDESIVMEFTNVTNLETLEENIKSIEARLESAKKNIDSDTEEITDYEFNMMDKIAKRVDVILHSISNRSAAISYIYQESTLPSVDVVKANIDVMEQKLALARQSMDYQKKLASLDVDSIPEKCALRDSCPLAKKSLLKDQANDKIAELAVEIDTLQSDIVKENNQLDRLKEIWNAIQYLSEAKELLSNNSSLLAKFGMAYTGNTIRSILEASNSFVPDYAAYYDGKNARIAINTITHELDTARDHYTKTLKEFNNYYQHKTVLDNALAEKKSLMEKTELKEIQSLKEEREEKTKAYDASTLRKTRYEAYLQAQDLRQQLDILNNSYDTCVQLRDKLVLIKEELDDITVHKYPSIKDEIDKLKYKLVLYNDYVEEYKKFSNKYNIIETVKKYASPSTGIQTVFMGMYMNDIISTSNQLLSFLFNGEYVLHPFVINESEFRIPCSGKGLLNDDISSMSTSQICMISMIISFALLHKSSSVYNIIKLDEMDGGLDSQNRVQFILLLQQMMRILGVSQCVMISHNSELNMSNADVIVLKNSDPNLKIDGNVIFRL